jgi:DNA invertase Pin-like site-specific DNA recombinase
MIDNPSFGRRIRPKKEELQFSERAHLKLELKAVVYKRLSKHEQVRTSRFSLERQHRLEQIAICDGYKPALSAEEIKELKARPDYPGYYTNGDIIVIEADLGISGTRGQEERPGLALLIQLIETGQVESIYCVDITRLFRDSDLIKAPAFALLCKEHGVIIIAEG